MSSTVEFRGTYVRAADSAPCSGSVTVSPADGSSSPVTAALDGSGAYALEVPFVFAGYQIVERVDGEAPRTFTTTTIPDATVDTSRGVNVRTGVGSRVFRCVGVPTPASCPGAAEGDVALSGDERSTAPHTAYRLIAGAWVPF